MLILKQNRKFLETEAYQLIREVSRMITRVIEEGIAADEFKADTDPYLVRRFRQEARSARRLAHENIVRIHDIGEEQGRRYISMELISGMTLKEGIREGALGEGLSRTLTIVQEVAAAMEYAHAAGIVHRDLKPANIMLTEEGRVKVTDFGIAKVVEGSEQTLQGAIMDTNSAANVGVPFSVADDEAMLGVEIQTRTSQTILRIQMLA